MTDKPKPCYAADFLINLVVLTGFQLGGQYAITLDAPFHCLSDMDSCMAQTVLQLNT